MPIYSIVDTNKEIICEPHHALDHYVLMISERPTVDHFCREDGTWGVDYTEQGKQARKDAINSPITVHDVVWQVDEESVQLMEKAASTHEYLLAQELKKPPEDRGIVPSNTQWILEDNTLRRTDYTELREVLVAHALRIEEVFRQYNIWRAGDRDHKFVFNPNV